MTDKTFKHMSFDRFEFKKPVVCTMPYAFFSGALIMHSKEPTFNLFTLFCTCRFNAIRSHLKTVLLLIGLHKRM